MRALALLAGAALVGTVPSALSLLESEPRTVRLTDDLREVSGLTFQGPDTVWAHNDERGAAFALDPRTGEMLARRVLGPRPVQGDFEGIAWDGEVLHMVTSGGTLVSFRPGPDEDVHDYGVRETAAGSWCEVEGIALDPRRHTLVMACKTLRLRGVEAGLLLLETALPPGPTAQLGAPLPVRVVASLSRDTLVAAGLPRRLALSDLAYDPARDSWLLVASAQGHVVEVGRDGRILGHEKLSGRRHPQPEGLALAPDGRGLLLADEGRPGRLAIYGSPRATPER